MPLQMQMLYRMSWKTRTTMNNLFHNIFNPLCFHLTNLKVLTLLCLKNKKILELSTIKQHQTHRKFNIIHMHINLSILLQLRQNRRHLNNRSIGFIKYFPMAGPNLNNNWKLIQTWIPSKNKIEFHSFYIFNYYILFTTHIKLHDLYFHCIKIYICFLKNYLNFY